MHHPGRPLPSTPNRARWLYVGVVSVVVAACAPTEDSPGEDSAAAEAVLIDDDGDGWAFPLDCRDNSADIHPGASERCNDVDDDCDGKVDDHPADGSWGWLDLDRDGWGDPSTKDLWCSESEDYVLPWVNKDGDCDDGDSTIHPASVESCDHPADENCNGDTNDSDALGCTFWYEDLDSDGTGTERASCLCQAEGNFRARSAGDCDDADPTRVDGCGLSGASILGENGIALIGAEPATFAGTSVSGAGDADGDGWLDVLVAGPQTGPSWLLVRGPFDTDRDLGASSARFTEPRLRPAFPAMVGGGIDLDGDGGDDLVLAGYGVSSRPAGGWTGVAAILGGTLSGQIDLSHADAQFESPITPSRYTMQVAVSQDTDGDDIGDLLVSGTWNQSAWVFPGPLEGTFDATEAACTIRGGEGDMGAAVAAAGDVDGDGLGDILVGAPLFGSQTEGAAWLVAGGMTGIVGVHEATAVMWGPTARASAGVTLAGPGDVDGDGYDDLLIGGRADVGGHSVAGSVWLVRGPVTGTFSLLRADARIDGVASLDAAYVIGHVGDLDRDGAADIVIGSPRDDTTSIGAGAAFVFFGPIEGTALNTDGESRLYGAASNDAAGTAIAGAGDLDLDGYPDFLVGAPGFDRGGWDAGGAFVVHGADR